MGEDGFLVPKDFREFFERDRLWVRHWLTRHARPRLCEDTLLDLEQDLSLYLCTLPPNSRFPQKGANERPDGCTDVVQCFDPVRHFGATAGRFHNFINLCLGNRLSTILAKRRLEPLCDPRNLSVANFKLFDEGKGRPELAGEIDEGYLLNHSDIFARVFQRRARVEDPVLKAYVREFEEFAEREDPKLLAVLHAIQGSGTLRDAERDTGMSNYEFRRCRRSLALLKNQFVEVPNSRIAESAGVLIGLRYATFSSLFLQRC